MRYAEALWRPMRGASSYSGRRKRAVLHTTEGATLEGAEAAYRAKNIAPHFTVCPATRRWAQHIDTASAASAMRNESGGVQTNREGAVQFEIVGFAANTQNLSDDDLLWLGLIVFEVCWNEGIDFHRHPVFVGTEAGTIATASARQRMSSAEWVGFNGVCGHQHVPENDHWDPGRFPYDRMVALVEQLLAALAAPPATPTPEPMEARMFIRRSSNKNHALLIIGEHAFVAHNGAVVPEPSCPTVTVNDDVWNDLVGENGKFKVVD